MRRQGQYGDPSPNTFIAAQMHNISGQRVETKSSNFEGRLEAFTPERENPFANSKPEGQWRWELEGSNTANLMGSRIFNEGQGGDASRSYFKGRWKDSKLVMQNQSHNDASSQGHEEDMDVGYEESNSSQTIEGLEQKFLDDIMKLSKEQNDAEDAENSRHRERLNTIGAQYEEKLAALRAQHASRREEYLRRESHARQHQYQQSIRDSYPSSGGMAPSDPHGYSAGNASSAVGEVQRGFSADQSHGYGAGNTSAAAGGVQRGYGADQSDGYSAGNASAAAGGVQRGYSADQSHGYSAGNTSAAAGGVQRGYIADQYDPYRERARFLGDASNQGFESRRGPYPGGRVYDTGSRYNN